MWGMFGVSTIFKHLITQPTLHLFIRPQPKCLRKSQYVPNQPIKQNKANNLLPDSLPAQSPKSNPPSNAASAPKFSRPTLPSNHTSMRSYQRRNNSTSSRFQTESRFTVLAPRRCSGNIWMTRSSHICQSYTSTPGASSGCA